MNTNNGMSQTLNVKTFVLGQTEIPCCEKFSKHMFVRLRSDTFPMMAESNLHCLNTVQVRHVGSTLYCDIPVVMLALFVSD